MTKRRIPGQCYLCGDPVVDDWFCAAHLWAAKRSRRRRLAGIGPEHAYWMKRFTPEQILEFAAYLEYA